MTEKQAFRKSIKKWENIFDRKEIDLRQENCALCQKFPSCTSCPINIKTGVNGCKNTPYYDWADHHRSHHSAKYYFRFGFTMKIMCANCEKQARAELDFLRNLFDELYVQS